MLQLLPGAGVGLVGDLGLPGAGVGVGEYVGDLGLPAFTSCKRVNV